MFDPITILAALAPLGVEAGKAAIQKWIAPDQLKPVTIEDYQKLKSVDLEFFKAMNEAGSGTPSYPFVEAIVRLQRPFVVACVLLAWAYLHLLGMDSGAVDNAASAVGFYLFGDRSLLYARKAGGK